jgi:hypothetical protein
MTAQLAGTKQGQENSLLAEMSACLRATDADLGDEAACILVLTGARFRAREINALLDDAIEAARVARAHAEHFPESADRGVREHPSQSIDREQNSSSRSQRRREEA